MRILYIDESYDEKNYALCGAFIVDMKYRKFCNDFNKLLKDLCNLNEDDELKGDHLFNGRSIFKNYTMEERGEIVSKIGEFLGKSNITKFIVGYRTNYEDEEKTYLEILDFIISKSAKLTSEAGKTSKQLMVIFDEREKKMEKKIHKKLMDKNKEIIKKYKSSCTFFDYGYSGISKNSRILQVADFVAYFERNLLTTPKETTLFEEKADERKIKLLQEFEKNIKEKLIIKEIN